MSASGDSLASRSLEEENSVAASACVVRRRVGVSLNHILQEQHDHELTTRHDHTCLKGIQPLDWEIFDAMKSYNDNADCPQPASRVMIMGRLKRNVNLPPERRCHPDSFRQSMRRLRSKGLVRTDSLSPDAYYVAIGSQLDREATTPILRGYNHNSTKNIPNLIGALSMLGDNVEAVHNPRLIFQCLGLYELIPDNFKIAGASEKRLQPIYFDLKRYANIVSYSAKTGTVCVEVSSSTHPFPRGSLLGLRDILERVRHQLMVLFPSLPLANLPLVGDWTVTQFEVNKDAHVPALSGTSFHLSFKDFEGVQHTLYIKDSKTGRVRLERKNTVHKTVSEVMALEPLMVDNNLPREARNFFDERE